MNKNTKTLLLILSFIGVIISGYLTYVHYAGAELGYCHFNDTFDCDKVNKSIYAEFLGLPVALFGFLMYLVLFIYSFFLLGKLKLKLPADHLFYIRLLTGVGVLFTLYLISIEAFVLKAWCIFCLIHSVLIFIIFTLLMIERKAA
ncbi:MAG: hypothetical protein A2817_02040 [Candidatus Yanofskybacteria bacterium RIFCSPHIGHO2_01_FULL_39_8b]|uniref:Vitamin K epoxide reductase domain-containing protein n=1 Tax=Candidatus Yanofskybacteria bacterium RIFCSPHIGHO2_01_FULL_39_8b TaxID=1802659 RepID=A0A1F8ED49_9BACT|nr:MAG: hypothetical protein A2817_02040 [Candidatus Yanofskybacteria bacterium RIFCSPHIGHO2_01_FULL_39_8b]